MKDFSWKSTWNKVKKRLKMGAPNPKMTVKAPPGYYRIDKKKDALDMNKKGQQVMVGMMILVMAVLIFISTLPAIKNVMDDARGCDYLNCAGFIDRGASGSTCSSTNQSYHADLDEDGLACTILDLGIPYLILGVLVGLIAKLLHGKLVEPAAPEIPYGYGGGY